MRLKTTHPDHSLNPQILWETSGRGALTPGGERLTQLADLNGGATPPTASYRWGGKLGGFHGCFQPKMGQICCRCYRVTFFHQRPAVGCPGYLTPRDGVRGGVFKRRLLQRY